MKHTPNLLVTAAVLFLLPAWTAAGEMKTALLFPDENEPQLLQTRFGTYGKLGEQTLFPELDRFRMYLREGIDGPSQSGIYSYVALAGDCEVTLTYELLNLPNPTKGTGTGLGLVFEAAEPTNRASIQRIIQRTKGVKPRDGYLLRSRIKEGDNVKPPRQKFIPAAVQKGRIGLRRINKEVIFLAANAPEEPLEQIGEPMPFTGQVIRHVLVFVDTGGSPTPVDVLVHQLEMRAEVIGGGRVKEKQERSTWWAWLTLVLACGLLVWRRLVPRRQPAPEEASAAKR